MAKRDEAWKLTKKIVNTIEELKRLGIFKCSLSRTLRPSIHDTIPDSLSPCRPSEDNSFRDTEPLSECLFKLDRQCGSQTDKGHIKIS